MSRSIESGAELAELGVELELERDRPAGVIDVLRRARKAERSIGPSPLHDEVLAALLVELRQTVADVRTIDQVSADRVKLRRRQAELERAVRDRARMATVDDRVRLDEPVVIGNDDDVDRVVVVSVSESHLVEVTSSVATRRIRRIPLDQPLTRLLDSIEFALHRLNREGTSEASRTVATAMLDDAAAALDDLLVPDDVRGSDRPIVVTPVDTLHGLPWRVLPSMRTRSITVSSSVGNPSPGRPHGRTLLIAGPGLAHADAEIGRIGSVVAGAVSLGSAEASVAAVTEQMARADVVHIACHGTFRTDNPLFSSLRLADGDLTVFELERCTSLPHTIVLSACNAGQAAVLRGGALLGFANTLMQLGLETVVAPLTPVSDQRSVEVMASFHRQLAGGDDAASALAAVSVDAVGRLDPTAASFSCFGI